MDQGSKNHPQMNHSTMDHSTVDHGSMDHGSTDHGSMDHGSMDQASMDHGMKMYFHASSEATILFHGWTVSSLGGMLGSCIGIFIMAALYEGLKCLRENLLRRASTSGHYGIAVPASDDKQVVVVEGDGQNRMKMISWPQFIQTLLHILQIVISYFLMLIVMTFNVYLFVAVALGAGAGYFLFNRRRAIVVDSNEHCN